MQNCLIMVTTVTGKNQITIPAALSAKYGLKNGVRIDWLETGQPDEILCRILPDPKQLAKDLRGAGRRFLKAGADPIADLLAERAQSERGTEAGL